MMQIGLFIQVYDSFIEFNDWFLTAIY